MHWLEVAVDRGFINYPFLARLDPSLENLRGEKSFNLLMETVRERWEAFST
jgi:eukaryotic-like serine/threonine-protein kinase